MSEEIKQEQIYSTVAETAKYFRVSDMTVRRWIKQDCPAVPVGASHRLELDKVRAWLMSRNQNENED